MKTISFMVLLVAVTGCAHFSNVPRATESRWYALSAPAGEYQAKLDPDIYNSMISDKSPKGWLRITNVFWEVEGEFVPQSEGGSLWGYSDEILINSKYLMRIVPLSEKHVHEHLEK